MAERNVPEFDRIVSQNGSDSTLKPVHSKGADARLYNLTGESRTNLELLIQRNPSVQLVEDALKFLLGEEGGKYGDLRKQVPGLKLDQQSLATYLEIKGEHDTNGAARLVQRVQSGATRRTIVAALIDDTDATNAAGVESNVIE